MFVDLLECDWVLKPIVEFETTQELVARVEERIVSPAEARLSRRRELLRELFGRAE